ncbi:lysylphosphatidylglycerol synthase domain-containing protein, partial [Caballeronia sp. BR00000012568055]|uniref:lysylphosphatidylglycerol synthase domain-containing protein n=1 Tax=Caballeronia sp. BR00000012568055 TaxID=2918761 RepID=UPI0023F92F72
MRFLASFSGLIGLIIAGWLLIQSHPETVFHLIKSAGPGLVLAALVHVFPMLANAWDWRTLVLGHRRPSTVVMLTLVWIRESINGLLPVARIGGEIVSFRMLVRHQVRPARAIASLIVDMQLTLLSQVIFAAMVLGYMFERNASDHQQILGRLAWWTLLFFPLLIGFVLIHHARPFKHVAQFVSRATSGK